MGMDKDKSIAESLRRKAEDELKTAAPDAGFFNTDNKTRQLFHELQVHELELKMQNVEMCRARDEMETALEKYTDLYDFAPVGYLSLDHEGTVLAANFTVAGFLGIERSRLLGRRFGQFVADEDRRFFADFLWELSANEGKKTCDVMLAQEENSPLHVQIDAEFFGSQECRVAVIDITGRKLTEERLRESENKHRAIIQTAIDGYMVVDSKGRLLEVNESYCRMSGYSQQELLQMKIADLEAIETAAETALHIQKIVSQGEDRFESRHRCKNGSVIDVESSVQYRPFAGGQFVAFLHDITARKKTEEKLQQAHDELEARVRERTSELIKANQLLKQEIEERKRGEELLQRNNEDMKGLKARLQAENIYLQQEIAQEHNLGDFIGQSQALSQAFVRIQQVAPMNATVLLLGETGTGKGVVARTIHSRSARKDRPLVTVNCTSLPANLIESELFGREKGAFTGADVRQIGRFELADGGTVFLDEIGEMPLDLQSKLMRVIQDGEFERLGSPHTVKVDVRLIVASNRNLEEEVRKGSFREDLFYRINIFPIVLPPLRQRREDIPLLVNHFVAKFNRKNGKQIETVSADALKMLQEYHWPGNVRELENVIERAVIISQGSVLQILDRFESHKKTESLEGEDVTVIAELEYDHILKVLQRTGWRINGEKGAALLLGLNPSTLRARIRKLDIKRQ